MKVSEEFETKHGGKIQIAKISDGGNSSWGNKDGYKQDSIRLAWYRESGGFDPISSAEVPIWGLFELVKVASQKDMLTKAEIAELIGNLTSSIYRQL